MEFNGGTQKNEEELASELSTTSILKFHEILWPEIFHEMFLKIIKRVKYFKVKYSISSCIRPFVVKLQRVSTLQPLALERVE